MKMFISKLPKTDSDRRSAIINYRCARQVGAGSQTQETDECQPSLKRNQVVKDPAERLLSLFPSLSIFTFSNNTVLVTFPSGFPNSNQNVS